MGDMMREEHKRRAIYVGDTELKDIELSPSTEQQVGCFDYALLRFICLIPTVRACITSYAGEFVSLQEKGKYECVAGQLKTAEEMVALYVELVQSSAGVVGICNPFRPEVRRSLIPVAMLCKQDCATPSLLQDLASWCKLHNEVGGHCYIFSGAAERPTLLHQQEQEAAEGHDGEAFANGTFVQLQPTVTKFCKECQRLQTSPTAVECLLELPERFTALSLELAADLVCCVVLSVCMCVHVL